MRFESNSIHYLIANNNNNFLGGFGISTMDKIIVVLQLFMFYPILGDE